jgi:uncharacterized protein
VERYVLAVLTAESLLRPDELWDFFVLQEGVRDIALNVEEREGANRGGVTGTEAQRTYAYFLSRWLELRQSRPEVYVRELDKVFRRVYATGDVTSSLNQPFAILTFDCAGYWSTFSPELHGQNTKYGLFRFGHVAESSPTTIIDDPTFQTVARAIQSGVDACRNDCEYFTLCGGGTPANTLAENGRFDSTETWHCRFGTQVPTLVVLGALAKKHGIPPPRPGQTTPLAPGFSLPLITDDVG